MYNILTLEKFIAHLKTLPTIREVSFRDATEIRYHTGLGYFICKLLAQKSANNKNAIKLYYDKLYENYG